MEERFFYEEKDFKQGDCDSIVDSNDSLVSGNDIYEERKKSQCSGNDII